MKNFSTFFKKTIDKRKKVCYNKDTIKQTKEVIKMFYIKSTITGQIYKVDEMPKFGGYEVATESEYIAYCKKMGIEP